MELARRVVNKMINGDAFSQWLGIEILEVTEGFCKLKMIVRKEMTNGFDIAHGGISYSLADSALAFAANSYGRQSFSVKTSISHIKKVMSGDTLIAETQEISKNDKSAVYNINITNQDNIEIAHFKGKVYRTNREWFPNKQD